MRRSPAPLRARTPAAASTLLRQRSSAAEALVTVVQSCFPSASIVFTHALPSGSSSAASRTHNVSGHLEVLQTSMLARLASRENGAANVHSTDPITARKSWSSAVRGSTQQQQQRRLLTHWWQVITCLSPPSRTCHSTFEDSAVAHFTPDAVVYIDGLEAADVAQVVAPQLVASIPVMTVQNSVGGAASTHGGQRQAPSYCRRRTDWDAVWREKRCALRGVDVLELSLPISATSARVERRASLLVSVANPTTTVASLHREKNSSRRGPLRSTFGYALPCLGSALPAAVVEAVQLLRGWQRMQCTGGDSAPCSSAFWVSALGHLLDTEVQRDVSPLCSTAQEWLRECTANELTEMEVQLLQTLTQDVIPAERLAALSDNLSCRALLAPLICRAMQRRVAGTPSGEWNAANYFLPEEQFDGTTDAASAALLHQRGSLATPLTLTALRKLQRSLQQR